MKLEKKLFKMSVTETFLYFALMFISLNGTIWMISLINGDFKLLAHESSWIVQFVFPVLFAIINTAIHRNGVLMVTSFSNQSELLQKIESMIGHRYRRSSSENGVFNYTKKTKLARFFDYFFRENVRIKATADQINVFAKRGLLNSLDTRLKYDK